MFYKKRQTPRTHEGTRDLPSISRGKEYSIPASSRQERFRDTSLQSYGNEPLNNSVEPYSAHKFFNLVKEEAAVDRAIPMFSYQPSRKVAKWEIIERIEKYEMKENRLVKNFETITENWNLWDQCFKDIYPLIKGKHSDLASGISKLNKHMSLLFDELKNMFAKKTSESKKEILESRQKIKKLETRVMELEEASEEMLNIKRREEEEIQKEIEDMFGTDDSEYLNFKKKNKQLQDIEPAGATDVLRDLYFEMSKERHIPKPKSYDLNAYDPDEIEHSMYEKFLILQKSTASRVIKLCKNPDQKSDKEVQITPEVDYYAQNEEQSKTEKLNLVNQSLQKQLETIRDEYNSKQEAWEKFEKERQQLQVEANKYKRDSESLYQDNINIKRELEAFRVEKRNLDRQLDLNSKNNLRLETKVSSLSDKVDALTDTIERNQFSLAQKDELIEKLKKKIAKKYQSNPEEGDISSRDSQPPLSSNRRRIVDTEESRGDVYNLGVPDIPVMSKRPSRPRQQRNLESTTNEPAIPEASVRQENKSPTRRTENRVPVDPRKNEANRINDLERSTNPENSRTDYLNKTQGKPTDITPRNLSQYSDTTRNYNVSRNEQQKYPRADDSNYKKNSEEYMADYDLPSKYNQKDSPTRRPPQNNNRPQNNKPYESSPARQDKKSQESEELKEDRTSLTNNSKRVAKSPQKTTSKRVDTQTSPNHISLKLPGETIDSGSEKESDSELIKVRDEVVEELISSRSKLNDQGDESAFKKPIYESTHYRQNSSGKASNVEKASDANMEVRAGTVIENKSVGVQFNWEQIDLDDEDIQEKPPALYLLPFNPNNIYGLRGDGYYNKYTNSLQAYPRIPELQDSIIFKNNYVIEERKQTKKKKNKS